MADNGKINHEEEMSCAAAWTFPFLNIRIEDRELDKRRAIQMLTRAADLYKKNLEDQKVLFLYGVPNEINRQLLADNKCLSQIKGYEAAFHRHNYLHLTGVIPNRSEIASSIHFYEKCVSNRLTKNDFDFSKDGSTEQKLDILENMMRIKYKLHNQ